MSNHVVSPDHKALSEVLNDPVMIRIATVLNLASLSILELLEYGLGRKDISRAMAKGVIEFEKSPMLFGLETMSKREVVQQVMETGPGNPTTSTRQANFSHMVDTSLCIIGGLSSERHEIAP